MAVTSLADMIVPTEFAKYVELQSTEKSRLFQSGIITDLSAQLDTQLEGVTVHLPYFNDLDSSDGEVVLDDTQDLTVSKISTGQDIAVKLLRGKAFGSNDLAGDLAGADPVMAIGNRFATWWDRRMQRALLATLQGAMGAASMAGNVHDITGLTGAAADFDSHSFIDAVYMLGDESSNLSAVAVHSSTMKAMVKADLITFIPDSEGKLSIPTYMGKQVIEDDSMPYDNGTGTYTTYIFGAGAIGYGSRSPKVPVEVERKALVGMGQEYIVNRKQWVMHPRGVKWVGTASKATPDNTELANPANWTRVYEQKMIRIVAFKHKLG